MRITVAEVTEQLSKTMLYHTEIGHLRILGLLLEHGHMHGHEMPLKWFLYNPCL